MIGESDLNDTRLLRAPQQGGFDLDAQWSDDFHHALHTLLTSERRGYYRDFGELEHLARAMRTGYSYCGQYSPYRQRSHGDDPSEIAAEKFVVCCQNHDQVGNRMLGERLTRLTDLEGQKLAAAAVLLSPFVPMIFMGEELGETAPFLYFVSHGDPQLVEAVRAGRRAEFSDFIDAAPSSGDAAAPPDPQAEETFLRSRIDATRDPGPLGELYRELIALRRQRPALGRPSKAGLAVHLLDDGPRPAGRPRGRRRAAIAGAALRRDAAAGAPAAPRSSVASAAVHRRDALGRPGRRSAAGPRAGARLTLPARAALLLEHAPDAAVEEA